MHSGRLRVVYVNDPSVTSYNTPQHANSKVRAHPFRSATSLSEILPLGNRGQNTTTYSREKRARPFRDSNVHRQVSMMQREREERLEGKMMFWGKVNGNENDYLVCYALATPTLEEGDFPLKHVG